MKDEEMPNVHPLRPPIARPQGRLKLVGKPSRPGWFDGREVRVSALRQPANARTIIVSVPGPDGDFHLPLEAGDAARLMFEIGYALEQAARTDRTPGHA
jgi:hypothetical protein